MLPPSIFAYSAAIMLDDGSEEMLDLELRGWAEPKRLARAKRFSLIPKFDLPLPIVAVNIPSGAKPVFKSRVFGMIGVGSTDGTDAFRCYAVGYKKGPTEYLTWILPGGDIEVGPDPLLADLILKKMKEPSTQ